MHINTDATKLSRKGTFFLILAAISFLVAAATWSSPLGKSILIVAFSALALGFYFTPLLRSFTFTAWVIAGVSAAICFPSAFGQWGELKLPVLIVPLVQLIMFGMGTTLSLRDFARVFTVPWPVIVGVLLQFTVMPITGYLIARAFGFEGEIAAGIILIGSCSGGVASNLMAYLAGANSLSDLGLYNFIKSRYNQA